MDNYYEHMDDLICFQHLHLNFYSTMVNGYYISIIDSEQ